MPTRGDSRWCGAASYGLRYCNRLTGYRETAPGFRQGEAASLPFAGDQLWRESRSARPVPEANDVRQLNTGCCLPGRAISSAPKCLQVNFTRSPRAIRHAEERNDRRMVAATALGMAGTACANNSPRAGLEKAALRLAGIVAQGGFAAALSGEVKWDSRIWKRRPRENRLVATQSLEPKNIWTAVCL